MPRLKDFNQLSDKGKTKRINQQKAEQQYKTWCTDDQVSKVVDTERVRAGITHVPNFPNVVEKRHFRSNVAISTSILVLGLQFFYNAAPLICARCFEESSRNKASVSKYPDGTPLCNDCCPRCFKGNPCQTMPAGECPLQDVLPTKTLDPITNIYTLMRSSCGGEIKLWKYENLNAAYRRLKGLLPGGNNRLVFRGLFAGKGMCTASMASMDYVCDFGQDNDQMPFSRLSEFVANCQWGDSMHVFLTPSVGSFSCYPSNIITFLLDLSSKIGRNRLRNVYFVAITNEEDILNVNAVKLLRFLQNKCNPDRTSEDHVNKWVRRMFLEFMAREFVPKQERNTMDMMEISTAHLERMLENFHNAPPTANEEPRAGPSSAPP